MIKLIIVNIIKRTANLANGVNMLMIFRAGTKNHLNSKMRVAERN